MKYVLSRLVCFSLCVQSIGLPLWAFPVMQPAQLAPHQKGTTTHKTATPKGATNLQGLISADTPKKDDAKGGEGKSSVFSLDEGFAPIVEPLLPAVVNVSVIKKMTTYSLDIGPQAKGGAPQDLFRFRDFLEQFDLAPKKRRVPVSAGTGFIIDPKGYLVTNAHVVEGADEVIVTLADQREMKAKVIGLDPRSDLALLKISDSAALPYVRFGDASKVRVGHWAIAIGNALGLGGTVTVGVISHVGRSFMMQPTHVGGFFQTDASINLGNSGGPLFNSKGEVIGINMMIASPTGGNIGIGFAIPSDVAQFVIEQLRQYGYVKRGWLGIHVQDINQDIAKSLQLKSPKGALVANVLKDGPASKGGVKQGDLILKINGVAIKGAAQTTKVVSKLHIGSRVPIEVWRRDARSGNYGAKVLYLTIGESDDAATKDSKKTKAKPKDTGKLVYGLTLQALDDQSRQRYHIDKNVTGALILKVHPESRASEFFKGGDVLVEVDQEPVRSPDHAQSLLDEVSKKGQKTLLCLGLRQGIHFFAPLNLDDDVTKSKEKS